MKTYIKTILFLIFIINATLSAKKLQDPIGYFILTGPHTGKILVDGGGEDGAYGLSGKHGSYESCFLYSIHGKIIEEKTIFITEIEIADIYKSNNDCAGLINANVFPISSLSPINKPPDLSIENIRFKTNPDNIIFEKESDVLYANSDGTLEFDLINNGDGKGQLISLFFDVKEDNLIYSKNLTIIELNAGESKHLVLPISAKMSSKSKNYYMTIDVSEYNGFDLDPVITIIKVKEIATPNFDISEPTIDDDKEGKSYGNNNYKINKGESIEVNTILTNIGNGESKETYIKLYVKGDKPNGLILFEENKVFYAETLRPGKSVEINVSFMINKRYNKSFVPLVLRVTEKSGEFTQEFDLDLRIAD